MPRISPTRMNLISLRRRVVTVRKGHDILNMKRTVLVVEFMKLLKQSRESRAYLSTLLQDAYKTTVIASTYVGNFELEELSYYVKEAEPISITVKNIMGVKIPEIGRGPKIRSQLPITASLAADDINESFGDALAAMVDVAEREQGLVRLVLEIEKTKRRVNALKYVVIPNMRRDASYISMRLGEMDRDMFSALKHVKKKLAQAQNEQK